MSIVRVAALIMLSSLTGFAPAAGHGDDADDAVRPDSAAVSARRDSIAAETAAYVLRYRLFPRALDSSLQYHHLYPHHLQNADASGISRALGASPFFVYVPYALVSSRNRALYLGLPTPRPYLFAESGLLSRRPPRERGDDWLFAGRMEHVSVQAGGPITLTPRQLPHSAPVAFLCWENGVFNENTLHVLFARPLTRTLSLGITSDYRSLRAMNYSHRRGGVYSFYYGIVQDTALVVRNGTNPLTHEHTVGARLQYQAPRARAGLSYTYLDLHNGRVYDSDSLGLRRDTLHQYGHHVDFQLATDVSERAKLDAALHLGHDIEQERRVTDLQGYYVSARDAALSGAALALQARYALSRRDSLTATLRLHGESRSFYDGRERALRGGRAAAGYQRSAGDTAAGFSIRAEAGYQLESLDIETGSVLSGHAPVWHGLARAWLGRQQFSVYARRDVLAHAPPFATEFFVPATIPEIVDMYGAEVTLSRGVFRLLAAYLYTSGVDSASLAHAWPENLPPYQEPHSVLLLAPALGRLAGFTLHGQWLLSDTRPYHKAQAGVRWERLGAGERQIIRLDLLMNYWSERERIEYGGRGNWHYSIFDVSGRASVQISTFRLFLTIDNMLNRSIAYLPGNLLPGLTFRWGFNWYFQR